MRIQDSVWQGSFGYWQSFFIQQNLLLIGYTAWNGYLTDGPGMVVCEISEVIPLEMDWRTAAVPFNRVFIPLPQTRIYLESLGVEDERLSVLSRAIATYEPREAIVLMMMGNGEIGINLLQHLAILPTECYEQVKQRWSEFQPLLSP